MSDFSLIKEIIKNLYSKEKIESLYPEKKEIQDIIENGYLKSFRKNSDYKLSPGTYYEGGIYGSISEEDVRREWVGWVGNNRNNKAGGHRHQLHWLMGNPASAEAYITGLGWGGQKNPATGEPYDVIPFLRQDWAKTRLQNMLKRHFYNELQNTKDIRKILILLNALFQKNPSKIYKDRDLPVYDFVPYIRLDKMFADYFDPLDAGSESLTEKEVMKGKFKNIETSESKKGMFHGIGYTFPGWHAENHNNIFEILEKKIYDNNSEYFSYWTYVENQEEASGSGISIYEDLFKSLQKIMDQEDFISFPLIGSVDFQKYFSLEDLNSFVSEASKAIDPKDKELVELLESFVSAVLPEDSTEKDVILSNLLFPELDFGECLSSEDDTSVKNNIPCDIEGYDLIPAEWFSMDTEILYYDENDCTYAISVKTEETTTRGNLKTLEKNYTTPAAVKILTLLNKVGTSEDISKLANNLMFDAYYINPKPLLKMRFLYKVKKEFIDSLDLQTAEDDSDFQVTQLYNINELVDNLEQLSALLKKYHKIYISQAILRGNIKYENLDFDLESKNVIQFSNNMLDLIRKNTKNSVSYENIEIAFSSDNKILFSYVSSAGSKRVRLTKGFNSFIMGSSQKRVSTVNFVKNIEEISLYISTNSSLDYVEFLKIFMVPEPQLVSSSQNLSDSKFKKITKDLGKQAEQILKQEIMNSLKSTPCLTKEQKQEQERQIEEKTEEYYEIARSQETKPWDSFFEQIPEIFKEVAQKQGQEALDELGEELLDKMGFCALGEMVSMAANSIISQMNASEYLAEIARCCMKNMDPDGLKLFFSVLEPRGQNSLIAARYQEFVGDTLYPWDGVPATGRTTQIQIGSLVEQQTGANVDFRLTAFADVVVATIDASTLLQTLRFLPGNQWLGFFIDVADVTLKQCNIPTKVDFQFKRKPKTPKDKPCSERKITAKRLPQAEDEKSGNVWDFIIQNMKNILINTTVQIITQTMQVLLRELSAAVAFDLEYLNSPQSLKGYFEDKDYFTTAAKKAINNSRFNNSEINMMFLNSINKLSNNSFSINDVSQFMQATAVSIDERSKIDLLKGQSTQKTKIDILEATSNTPIGEYFSESPDKIDDYFSNIGSNMSIETLRQDLKNKNDSNNINTTYCPDPNLSFEDALSQNKKISDEEVIKQQQKQANEANKEKLCNLANMLAADGGPIVGSLMNALLSKDGPIYGVLSNEKYKIFKKSTEDSYNMITFAYLSDFKEPNAGFLDLVLNNGSTGFLTSQISSDSAEGEALEGISNLLGGLTENDYNGELGSYSYELSSSSYPLISLKQENEDRVTVETNGEIITEYIQNPKYSPQNSIEEVFNKSLQNLPASERDSIKNSFIKNELDKLISDYTNNLVQDISDSQLFTYNQWKSVYTDTNQEFLEKLLNVRQSIESNSSFYRNFENDPRLRLPPEERNEGLFARVYTKQSAAKDYIFLEVLTKIYVIEFIFKSYCTFSTFSVDFFERSDLVSKYIVKNMMSELFSIDQEFVNSYKEKVVQLYASKITMGLQSFNNIETQDSLSGLNTLLSENENLNLEEFLKLSDVENFVNNIISDFAENTVRDVLENLYLINGAKFKTIEQFVFQDLFDKGQPYDVVPSVTDLEPTLSQFSQVGKYFLEKYIIINEKEDAEIPSFVSGRSSDTFGVVPLARWQDWLESNKTLLEDYNIEDLWQSWQFGMRIVYCAEGELSGVKEHLNSKMYKISTNTDKVYSIIPLLENTWPVENTKLLSQYGSVTVNLEEDYKLACLVQEMYNSEEFKKLFTEVLDTESLISLMTIYIVDNFKDLLKGEINSPVFDSWYESGGLFFQKIKKILIESEKILTLAR